jgi:hypothetical protein
VIGAPAQGLANVLELAALLEKLHFTHLVESEGLAAAASGKVPCLGHFRWLFMDIKRE